MRSLSFSACSSRADTPPWSLTSRSICCSRAGSSSADRRGADLHGATSDRDAPRVGASTYRPVSAHFLSHQVRTLARHRCPPLHTRKSSKRGQLGRRQRNPPRRAGRWPLELASLKPFCQHAEPNARLKCQISLIIPDRPRPRNAYTEPSNGFSNSGLLACSNIASPTAPLRVSVMPQAR